MRTVQHNKMGGISANRVVLPIIVILAILHATIIGLIFTISSTSNQISQTMRESSVYIEDATSLLGGASLLSESCTGFILMPVTSDGEVNISPLASYANELQTDRRGDDVLAKFQSYDVSQEAMDYLTVAANCANNSLEAQLHAIALVDSVYPIPDVPPLDSLPLPALTAEEQAMPDEAKLGQARVLVLGMENGLNKQSISQNVNACTDVIKAEMGQKAAVTAQHLGVLRTALWAVTISIIVLLAITFLVFYRQLISPLDGFVRLIVLDRSLDEGKGLEEVRMLASAYNALLRRRDALDGILRSAAETDTLTNLPNRYSFEQCLLELKEEGGCPVGVLLFDVNNLKYTNDTYGHAAGDQLLRSSAECISTCFGDPETGNCFRIGGDEFAAVVKDTAQEDINEMIQRFRADQAERNISIAWGCSWIPDIGETTFSALMDLADKEMYQRKKEMHRQERSQQAFTPTRT